MATDYNAIVPIPSEANHPKASGRRVFITTKKEYLPEKHYNQDSRISIGISISETEMYPNNNYKVLFPQEFNEHVPYEKKLPEVIKVIGPYAAFLAVGLPLSLWFYVRNLVRWHVPLLWVYTLPDDSWQYVGGVPLVNRFLWPVPSEFLGNLRHFTIGCGYNVWLEIIRTSMLGEWDMAGVGRPVKMLAVLLMLVGTLLGLLCTIDLGAACSGGHGREKGFLFPEDRLLLGLTWLITMVCYLKFVYDYPQQCSMNFRYIAVVLVPTAAAAGLRMAPDAGTRRPNCQSRPFQALWRGAHRFLLVLFCLLSAGMIAVWAA